MNLYYYEIMDRTHIIMEQLQIAVLDSAGITPEMTKLAEEAHKNLFDLYQLAGREFELTDTSNDEDFK
jgi:hypothetical protein